MGSSNEENDVMIKRNMAICVLVLGLLGTVIACDELQEVCGPCGKVSTGDTTISGDAKLDGFFKAVGTLGAATATIQGDFRGEIEALAEVFGSACAAEDAATACADLELGDLVAEVKGTIEAEIDANVTGSLSVKYEPPKCSANASVAVEAQAQCEAKAKCDVSTECQAGEVDVTCSGQCSGSCEGECTGGTVTCEVELEVDGTCGAQCQGSCEVKGPSVACEGTCAGTCTVEAGAECTGTCDGNCTGTCDGTDITDAPCAGECEGDCTAQCHIQGSGTCEGTCNGECEYTPADGSCEGSCKGECHAVAEGNVECDGQPLKCEGKCDGSCSAECNGTVTPPSCSAEGSCEASAECKASASAQASASLECTPPSLEVDFSLAAGLDAQAKAEFLAKMEELKLRMVAIVQGMFKLRALVDVDYATEIGIESPITVIEGQIEGFIDLGISEFDVPKGLLPCVIPAFDETIDIMAAVASDTVGTIQGQLEIVAVLNIG
jgi:hypothetical protein